MRILLQCGLLASLLALFAMVDLSNASRTCGGCQCGANVRQTACHRTIRTVKKSYWRRRTRVYYSRGPAYCCSNYRLYGATCLKNTCGISKYSNAGIAASSMGPAIVGGRYTRPNEFPWHVSIRAKGTNRLICGGTIISTRHILTSAHCVRAASKTGFRVYVGDHRLSRTEYTQRIHNVARSVVHRSFSATTFANDVAIIRLTTYIRFNANVQAACLPKYSSKSYINRNVIISGWGSTSTRGSVSDRPRYAKVRVATASYCKRYYGRSYIGPSILCVTDNRRDRYKGPCYGDAGSPMMVKESDGKWYLVGLSSFISAHHGCAGGLPSGYQNVAYHLKWIKSHMN